MGEVSNFNISTVTQNEDGPVENGIGTGMRLGVEMEMG